jgi:hypothetical protein
VDRGLYWLRGFPDRWRLYEVEWGRDATGTVGPVRTPARSESSSDAFAHELIRQTLLADASTVRRRRLHAAIAAALAAEVAAGYRDLGLLRHAGAADALCQLN